MSEAAGTSKSPYFSQQERVRLDFFVAETIGAPRVISWRTVVGGEAMWALHEMLQRELGRFEVGTGSGVREMLRSFMLTAPEHELITMLGLLPFACQRAREQAEQQRSSYSLVDLPDPSVAAQRVNIYLARIGHPARFVGREFRCEPIELEPPKLVCSSDVVEAALRDWQKLRYTSGAPAALDRLHTAFHGYLKAICDKVPITYEPNADITKLYKAIRKNHPTLQATTARAYEVNLILGRLAGIVSVLNPIRNNATLAHPNELLPEPEAVLVGNCIHTLFHYLNSRCH